MSSFSPPGGGFRTINSDPKNPSVQDHPLHQRPDDVELASSRQPTPSLSYAANASDSTLPPPRAPFQFQPPPLGSAHPPPPLPAASAKPTVSPPLDSSTRTLDEFVDSFLLETEDNVTPGAPKKLLPDPLPSDMPDFERLTMLMTRRAYVDAAILTRRLLSGPNSHYAPIWLSLLNEETSSLALESQQQELMHILLYHMEVLVKLKRYSELRKDVTSWTFAHSNNRRSDRKVCPAWVPWSVHIAVAGSLAYSSENDHQSSSDSESQSLDALYNIRADIPGDDFISRFRVDQMICNICTRRKEWRLALASLQTILDNLPDACRQHCASSGEEQSHNVHAALVAAYTCELLSRQGRILLQAGATSSAATIFEQAAVALTRAPMDPALAERYACVTMASASLAMNEGLVAFANSQYEIALECFRRANQLVKPLCEKEAFQREEWWSIEDALMPETAQLFYSNCANNMALCAIYTCRLHEAIYLMESLVRENPAAFLTERVALNLCTLYELQCDSAVAARKKRVLQLLAKRFSLQDIGAECFRLQQQ